MEFLLTGDACECLKGHTDNKMDCQDREKIKVVNEEQVCSVESIRSCVLCHFTKTPKEAKNAGERCSDQCLG